MSTSNDLSLTKGKLAEWCFRLLVIIGILYLSANYVSLKDYKADELRKTVGEENKTKMLNEIIVTLARIDERGKLDDTKTRVSKLEEKVQELEKNAK